MKYFKNNNEIYAYDEEQISQGYGSDMIEVALEEVNAINQAKQEDKLFIFVHKSNSLISTSCPSFCKILTRFIECLYRYSLL